MRTKEKELLVRTLQLVWYSEIGIKRYVGKKGDSPCGGVGFIPSVLTNEFRTTTR